jgi:hypothetical protein
MKSTLHTCQTIPFILRLLLYGIGCFFCAVLLAGCFQAPVESGGPAESTGSIATLTPLSPATAVPSPLPTQPPTLPSTAAVPTSDPNAPVILLARPVGAYMLNVIRYTGPQGVCLALSFDTQTLPVNHCGTYNGSGVGFVTALTDPDGGTVRVAYGLTLDPAITAVAVEFTDGGNTNSFTENGAYLILLDGGRSPRRATGVNQFGNMVGQWTFTP